MDRGANVQPLPRGPKALMIPLVGGLRVVLVDDDLHAAPVVGCLQAYVRRGLLVFKSLLRALVAS